jgi:hypothetical protein
MVTFTHQVASRTTIEIYFLEFASQAALGATQTRKHVI